MSVHSSMLVLYLVTVLCNSSHTRATEEQSFIEVTYLVGQCSQTLFSTVICFHMRLYAHTSPLRSVLCVNTRALCLVTVAVSVSATIFSVTNAARPGSLATPINKRAAILMSTLRGGTANKGDSNCQGQTACNHRLSSLSKQKDFFLKTVRNLWSFIRCLCPVYGKSVSATL